MSYSLELIEFNNLFIMYQNTFKIKPLNIEQNENNQIIVYFDTFLIDAKKYGNDNKPEFLNSIAGIGNKKSLICYDKNEQKKYDMIIMNNPHLLADYNKHGMYYYDCICRGDFTDEQDINRLKTKYKFSIINKNNRKYILKNKKYHSNEEVRFDALTLICKNPPINN